MWTLENNFGIFSFANSAFSISLLTRIMQENGISILSLRDDGLVGINDIFVGGLGVFSVVKKHGDVFFFEAVNVHNVFFHVEDIVPLNCDRIDYVW
jgi:hypothetical protein